MLRNGGYKIHTLNLAIQEMGALRFLEIPQTRGFKTHSGNHPDDNIRLFLDVLLFHLISDSEEEKKKEKKTKKGTKKTDPATVNKHPVLYVSDSGEGVNKQISPCII